jgi:hypothetical protein
MNARSIAQGLFEKSDSSPSMPVPAADPAFDEAPGYFRHFIAHYWQPLAKEVHSMAKVKRWLARAAWASLGLFGDNLPDWLRALASLLGGQ